VDDVGKGGSSSRSPPNHTSLDGNYSKSPTAVGPPWRYPFEGIGKPEPLKHLGPGTWYRRITQEHRLVYSVEAERIDFLQALYHY
jgi:Txe/YoeB family toxin of toxin-antitoxin system